MLWLRLSAPANASPTAANMILMNEMMDGTMNIISTGAFCLTWERCKGLGQAHEDKDAPMVLPNLRTSQPAPLFLPE